MSVFSDEEIEYLRSQTIGRLATVGPDGRPHVIPLTYVYNAEADTIDLGGIDFAAGKKWRDAQRNPKVTFLVDHFDLPSAQAVEIRADAELHETGGSKINPRFPHFVEQFMRLRPRHIVSWSFGGEVNSRPVPPG